MAIQNPYRQLDEVMADDDDVITSISDIYHSRVQPDPSSNLIISGPLATIKWPKIVGIVQIVNGFITGLLGALEVFILPLLEDTSDENAIFLGKRNCYGAGIYAGIMMIVTGSTAVRSSISQRGSTITRYIILLLISLLFYAGFSLLFIIGYSKGWTEKHMYPESSSLYEVHIFLTASIILGLLFVVAAFIQYHQVVFFGEIQLCQKLATCCLTCGRKDSDTSEDERITTEIV